MYRFLLLTLLLVSLPVRSEYAIGYLHLKKGQPEKAYKEFRELAEVGYAFYMNMIADMHLSGLGVPKSPLLAHVWYSLSAAQDDVEGIKGMQAVEKKLSPSELKQSKKLTRDYAKLYLAPLVKGWSLK